MKFKLKIYQRLFLIALLVLCLPKLFFFLFYQHLIYNSAYSNKIEKSSVAIVFGAGLQAVGEPSLVLADRVSAAVHLLKAGKVEKLILSGKKIPYYNEVKAMKNLALRLGVKEEQLLYDEEGFRTYDSCLNAQKRFQTNDVILVTQHFHLPRAIFLCRHLGIKTQGLSSDISPYSFEKKLKWNVREIFASWKALLDLALTRTWED